MHLAIILDGNRRWAKAKGLPAAYGHHRGVQNLKDLLPAFIRQGVKSVTAYALSTENLTERSSSELKNLFREIEKFGADLAPFHTHEIQVRIYGRLAQFPADTRRVLQHLVKVTTNYQKLTLNLGLGYGGRDELVRAANKLAKAGQRATEKSFAAALDSAGAPDPDLLIRTGGKSRLSNFLPWQLAYAELYFTPKFWPEFDAKELKKTLKWYAEQQRNFGK
jgi:undecaprenyl diphosphate synthase